MSEKTCHECGGQMLLADYHENGLFWLCPKCGKHSPCHASRFADMERQVDSIEARAERQQAEITGLANDFLRTCGVESRVLDV